MSSCFTYSRLEANGWYDSTSCPLLCIRYPQAERQSFTEEVGFTSQQLLKISGDQYQRISKSLFWTSSVLPSNYVFFAGQNS